MLLFFHLYLILIHYFWTNDIIILVAFPFIIHAQYDGKIFKSKSGRIIHFTDSNRFSVRSRIHIFIGQYYGKGTYKIEGNRLIASFEPYQDKEVSFYQINESLSSDTTEIFIECIHRNADGKSFPCEFTEWWISDSNDSIIKRGRYIGINSQIKLTDFIIPQGAIIHFNDFNTSKLSFPLIPNAKTHYSVVLKERIKYFEEGEMKFKVIRTKDDKIMLRLINGKKFVGYKEMDFVLCENRSWVESVDR